MDFNSLSLSQKIMLPAGALLILMLLIAPWHSVDLGFSSLSRTAVQSPGSFWGLVALLLAVALLAVGVMRAFGLGSLPETVNGQSWGQMTFLLSVVILALLLVKLVTETEFLGWGAWVVLLLAGGQAYGGFEGRKS